MRSLLRSSGIRGSLTALKVGLISVCTGAVIAACIDLLMTLKSFYGGPAGATFEGDYSESRTFAGG